jgi:glyoxalase family protein
MIRISIHHVTAMTDDAERNYKFFTEVLGMRLVKKTVNQDDIYTLSFYIPSLSF